MFLVDGTANGIVSASIPNWTGTILTGRYKQLTEMVTRTESRRAGCYILQGEEPSHPFGVRAYIGQATHLADRLRTHASSRDWWTQAALISTSDQNFTAGHFLALEARMIELAANNNRAALDNVQAPTSPIERLGEADTADMENFLDQVRLVLPVLGFGLLKDSAAAEPERPDPTSSLPVRLQIAHLSGLTAHAVMRDDEFIVLAGSQAIADDRYQKNGYAALRDRLVADGTVSSGGGEFLVFVRDVSFSSSSAAASVILNRQSSGPKEWKVEDGRPLGLWQEDQGKYEAVT